MNKQPGISALAQDGRGATSVEYGLIVAMIVIAMIVTVRSVASANTAMWSEVADDFSSTR